MDTKELKSAAKRKPPAAGKGRKKGSANKTTTALKEAILLAAAQVGEDGKGKGELTGYLRRVARENVKAFSGLLGRVLPLQVTGEGGGPVQVEKIVRVVVRPKAQPA
jgi:hypothetical protein